MQTVRSALADAAAQLDRSGVQNAGQEAAWLLAHLLGCTAGALRLRGEERLPSETLRDYARLVGRRVAREPIQYVIGTEEFMGMEFRVTPAVLIPRLDTETLVRAVAERLTGRVRLADIGTGSGAIAVGLASLLPEADIVATDLSPDALAVARSNARALGYASRIDFRQGDLLQPLGDQRFDAIVSNPPYIDEAEVDDLMPEVREWEPRMALTPGPDGLVIFRRLLAAVPAFLKPGGFLAVEVGAGQAGQVAALFGEAGLTVSIHADTASIERAIIGVMPAE